MSLVKFFLFFIIGSVKCHNTSSVQHEWKTRRQQWLHDNGKSSGLSGRKNVISLRSDLADVIFETEVICLFEFMRKRIDFIFSCLLFEVRKKYLLCLLKEITFIVLTFIELTCFNALKQISSNRVNISNGKHEKQKFVLKNSGYKRLTSTPLPNGTLR